MENIRALTAVPRGQGSPVAALQADARAVISQVASSSGVSEAERAALVKAAVDIDQYINAQPARAGALAQVAGLGVYLNQTSTTSWPRWTVLTALRSYGLNLSDKPKVSEQVAQQQVQAQLAAVAKSSRNVSLETALAEVKTSQTRVVKPEVVSTKINMMQKQAPAPKVDQVV